VAACGVRRAACGMRHAGMRWAAYGCGEEFLAIPKWYLTI